MWVANVVESAGRDNVARALPVLAGDGHVDSCPEIVAPCLNLPRQCGALGGPGVSEQVQQRAPLGSGEVAVENRVDARRPRILGVGLAISVLVDSSPSLVKRSACI